jgi:uncharacterized small protein (DUF1192 family)
MISFRLTAEEYERFLELCYSQGIRSVSEMARAAINMMFAQPERAPEETLEVRVAELEGRFRLLALEVKRLSQQGAQSAASATSGATR